MEAGDRIGGAESWTARDQVAEAVQSDLAAHYVGVSRPEHRVRELVGQVIVRAEMIVVAAFLILVLLPAAIAAAAAAGG